MHNKEENFIWKNQLIETLIEVGPNSDFYWYGSLSKKEFEFLERLAIRINTSGTNSNLIINITNLNNERKKFLNYKEDIK